MPPEQDEVYLDWLASSPKGVRWDKAQEMYALYRERLQEQAEAVARRLLGKSTPESCRLCGFPIGKNRFCYRCRGQED